MSKYLKHWNKFYKEINIDSLTKKDLIDIIENAIVVNPQIINNVITKEIYRQYPRWKGQTWTVSSVWWSASLNDIAKSNLNKMNKQDLYSLSMSVN